MKNIVAAATLLYIIKKAAMPTRPAAFCL